MKEEGTSKKVLIVDDDVNVCASLKLLLAKRTTYKVDITTDPFKGLEMIRANQYHVAIVDLVMPEMSGIDLLREAKNIAPDLEVVILTGVRALDKAVTTLQHRAYDYLEKPVQSERLLTILDNAFTKGKLARELSVTVEKAASLNRSLKQRVREQLSKQMPMEMTATTVIVSDTLDGALIKPLETIKQIAVPTATRLEISGSSPEALRATREILGAVRAIEGALRELRQPLKSFRLQPVRHNLATFVRRVVEEFLTVFPGVKPQLRLASGASEAEFDEAWLKHVLKHQPRLLPGPVEAEFDEAWFTYALHIVLENSVDSMNGTGTLKIALEQSCGDAVLTVIDSGPGIPDHVLPHLCEPFLTTKGTIGAGLGLAIVRRILADHHGRLEVSNSPVGGACVRLIMPRAV